MRKLLSALLSIIMLVSCVSVIDVTSYAAAGNSFSTATSISLNTNKSGSITNSNSIDYYKFTLPTSGKITVPITFSMNTVQVSIYDSNQNSLYNTYLYNNTGNASNKENITKDLVSGTYYFIVERYDKSCTGNYDFNINFKSANETLKESQNSTNNGFSCPSNIKLNSNIVGQIALNDTVDYYKFTLPTSGKITVPITFSMNTVQVSIYDSNQNSLYYTYLYNNTGNASNKENITKDLVSGTYYFIVERYDKSCTGNYNFKINFTLSSKPKSIKVSSRGVNSLKLAWSKSGTATGYEIQKKSGSSYKAVGSTTNTYYTIKSLSSTYKYTFRIRAYRTINSKKYYGPWVYYTTITKPATVSIKTPSTNSKHQIIVKWNTIKRASGYQVQYCKDKKCSKVIATKTVSGQSKASYTGKNFTKGKTYYVRVRAYRTVNSTKYYGSWSSVKSIKSK